MPRPIGPIILGHEFGPSSGSPHGHGLDAKENYVSRPNAQFLSSWPTTNHVQVGFLWDPGLNVGPTGGASVP